MNTLSRFFVLANCFVFQTHIAFAHDLSKNTNWVDLSSQAADSIIQSHSFAVNGQVYGEVFIAQDFLLNISRDFYVGNSQWNELKQEFEHVLSPPLKKPEKAEVAKAWQTEILEQLYPDELDEIERFVRTSAGKHFLEAIFRANRGVEFNLWERNLAPLEQVQRQFTENASAIAEKCKCKKPIK